MVDSKLISQKDTTVEVIDFRKDHIRDLFSNSLPDQALQKLITEKSGDSFLGLSRPFKLITIPHKDDIDYLIKGNQAKQSRWDIWERLLSESNLNLESLSILPLICYEIIFPHLIQNSNKDTNLIINISEDGWFGNTIGPHQHFAKGIFRAIEQNTFLIRSANKGISAIITNKGEVLKD